MDIQRHANAQAKRIRRIIYGTATLILVGGVPYPLSRLRQAPPEVDLSTIWTDAVKRGPMVREVRGLGTLVPEDIRWIAAQTDAHVDKWVLRPPAPVKPDSVIIELGDPTVHVTPGMNLARVADPRKLRAEIKIAETQAKDVAPGQQAVVDTRNGIVNGHVSRIDPSVINGTVTVDVTLDDALPAGARPDLSVDGTIILENLRDVLYVGRPVHGQSDSTIGLFKLDANGSQAQRVNVKLGRSSVNTIEILDGLKAGDTVILSDMSAVDRYERIRLK